MVGDRKVNNRLLTEKCGEGFVVYCKGRWLLLWDGRRRGFNVAVVRTTLVVDAVLCPIRLTSPHSVSVGRLAVLPPQ